jgi:hypothetical protein
MEPNYQNLLLDALKKTVPGNINLAEEISQLLAISLDSTYRRLRGETELTLKEAITICRHFEIPLEMLLNTEIPDIVAFKINSLNGDPESFENYLTGLHADLSKLNRYENRHLQYAAEDLPVFYHFFYPRLSAFKMMYWTKSILNVSDFQPLKVEDWKTPEKWIPKIQSIAAEFLKVPTTEIWNDDTVKSTIQQIRFYWEAGFFRNNASALEVVSELRELVESVQKQAETGKKYLASKGTFVDTDYSLYISDLMVGNNCVFLSAEGKHSSYIGYNSFNYMRTTNKNFNLQVEAWLGNLTAKSTLVSKVGEKQRNQFFKAILQRISQLEEQILQD